MKYNVARGEMAKKTKKDGTISKVNDVKATYATGNIIETNFGIFTSVKAEQRIHIAKSGKQYKVWFVTLKDTQGNTFTIKHQQCKNKNMPKGTVINRPVIAGLLPAPKELIDQLVEQVERLVQQYNEPFISNPANYTSKGKLKTSIRNMLLDNYQQFIQEPQYNTQFANKVDFIANALDIIGNITITKKIGRILKRNYHPDSNIGSTEKFMLINKLIRY